MGSGIAELLGSEFTLFAVALAGLAVTGLAIVRDLRATPSSTAPLSAVAALAPVPVAEVVGVL